MPCPSVRQMRIDFSPSRRTSLDVARELELVDLDTRELTGASDAILAAMPEGRLPVVDLLRDGLGP